MKKAVKEMFAHEIARAFEKGCIVGDKDRNHYIDSDIKIIAIMVLQDYTRDVFRIGYRNKYDNFEKSYLLDYETAYIEI